VSKEFGFNEIYKGFIIPIRGINDEPQYIKVISVNESVELFNKMTELVEALLEEFLSLRGMEKLKSVEDLSDFLDFFVLFVRNSLYLDIVPGKEGIPSPVKIFHYYVSLKNKPRRINLCSLDGLKEYEEIVSTVYKSTEVDWSREEKLRKVIEKALQYPADTRPLANASSLLLHSFVVSAFASCKYLAANEKFDRKALRELTALRMASIFHDFGKYNFRNWHSHESVSAKFLGYLRNQYATDEAGEVIDLAISIIGGNELYSRYYKDADVIASASDRIRNIFYSLVEEDEDVKRRLDEAARRIGKTWSNELYDEWEFWEVLGQENIKEITERFCRKLSSISVENPVINELINVLSSGQLESMHKDVLFAKIDLKSIQSYIHANDIRTMKGASRIVDTLIMLSIPSCLHDKFQLPYECFLLYGGGNVTFIIPEPIKESVREELHKIEDEFNIGIAYAYAGIYSSFNLSDALLSKELNKEKITSFKSKIVLPNIFRLCSYCGYRFATEEIDTGEYVCSLCKNKYDIGNKYHYGELISRLGVNVDPKYILEYIGGLDIGELEKPEEYLNIAFLRADVNLAGQFMSSVISITDAFERSVRIDSSLKKAFRTILDEVKKKNVEDYKRIVLGVVYMGGDDASLLVPSKLVVPLGYALINEYFLNMGCKSTLSVGIAIAKPKHPIIYLYESAGYILNKRAKDNSRDEALLIHQNPPVKDSFRGSLSLFVVEQGTMLPENIDHVMNTIYEERISMLYEKPFMVVERSKDNSILRYFEFLINQNLNNPDSLTLSKILDKVYESSFGNSLKDIRTVLLKTLQVKIGDDNSLNIKIVFSKREELTNNEKSVLYGQMLNNLLYLRDKGIWFTLYDLYLFLESFLGGVKR